jgi:glucose-6-phosphate isomerase
LEKEKISLDYSKRIILDYTNVMSDNIGHDGIDVASFENILNRSKESIKNFEKKNLENKTTWRQLIDNQNEICDEILGFVEKFKYNDDIENFVVFGIGGSALGSKTLNYALHSPYYNELSRDKRNGWPRFYVMDNIDPEILGYFFEFADIKKTVFNVISKSGNTCETMSQFMIVKDKLEKELGKDIARERIICTTDKEKGILRKIANIEGYKTFCIPDGVGGRFSVLSPVGLLPAAATGINIKELLSGAKFIDEMFCSDPNNNWIISFTKACYLSFKHGKNILVMMPYANSLKYISDWFAQLWSESLGKKKVFNVNSVFYYGQTPVKSLGVTDQHSQLQLYNDGPRDKLIIFIDVNERRRVVEVPKIFSEFDDISFLAGITHNDLIKTELKATEYSLVRSGRHSMTINLPKINEFYIGQLFYALELSAGITGEFFGIDAYDQPGVEECKDAIYAMLDKPGFEEKKNQIDKTNSKKIKFID